MTSQPDIVARAAPRSPLVEEHEGLDEGVSSRSIAGAAHDVRNLLMSITGYTEIVLRQLDAEDDKRADLGEVLRAADHAERILRRFVTRAHSKPVPIELNEAIGELRRLMVMVARPGSEIVFFSSSEPVWTIMPREMLARLMTNLVANAGEAMPDGGIISIAVASADPAFVDIVVSDEGVGMDAAALRQCMEPSFTTKPGSAGLGLSSCRTLVDELGGDLRIQSEPKRGTTVRIQLPRCLDKEAFEQR